MEKQGKVLKSNENKDIKKPVLKPFVDSKPADGNKNAGFQKTKKVSAKIRKLFEQKSGKIQ